MIHHHERVYGMPNVDISNSTNIYGDRLVRHWKPQIRILDFDI